ncbi:sugar transferase [Paenibacillus sp. FSL L8-0463]|uniref:sugar transferase n=1 Tax=Paenibacillus sp. FSL L8-0463 TaxID=2954687 RepID=UPI00311A1ACD
MKPYTLVKQIIDFLLALIGFLLLWPFFLIISTSIKLSSKGPIFFKQKRVGKNKNEFYILKFRTMRTDAPKDMPTHLLTDPGFFITKIGKFLRKTSLDELPQIINILKGEMSIVGPRPALWNQFDLIAERDKYGANNIKPGLTGWAQINGRDELPIEEKAKLDGHYTSNITLSLDIKIFFITILTVFKADGVQEGASDQEVASNTKGAIF